MLNLQQENMKYNFKKVIKRVRRVPFQLEVALKTWDNFDVKLYEKIVKVKSQNI